MNKLRLALSGLSLALLPTLAVADDETTYRLRAKEDMVHEVDVKLVILERSDGRITFKRTATYAHGGQSDLTGLAKRTGNVFAVQYDTFKGASSLLSGPRPKPIQASYELKDGELSGFLYDPGRLMGWSFTLEYGRVETAPTAPPVAPGVPLRDPTAPTTPTTTPTTPDSAYAPAGQQPFKRVVFCLDGIPYRVMKRLHGQGLFKGFSAPGRMISVYPSLSSISWNSLLGLPPEPGYQAVYYSNSLGKSMGVTMRKMKGSRFQSRVHYRHTGIVGHALAYIMPYGMGKRQLKDLVHEVLEHKSSKTAFIYAYQTDPVAHMAGLPKLERILKDFDGQLTWLQTEYRKRHGEEIEIVIVSDHGHTLVSGELVKLSKHLKKNGWKFAKKVKKKNEASFTTAGILASIALHCQEASEAELAKIVATMPGVDVCTYDQEGLRQFVVARDGVARFDFDPRKNAYRYTIMSGGDPLGYRAVYRALQAKGKVDAQGYARSRDLFNATVAHEFPDAPARIRRGHTSLVRNPANVLVSLKDKFENGAGMVKLTASLRGRSGTHGAMNQSCSAGIFMTNYRPTVPAIRTRDFAKYVDLSDYLANDPPIELTAAPHVGSEKRQAAPESPDDEVRPGLWLEMRDTSAAGKRRDVRTTIKIKVERARFLLWDKSVWKGTFDGKNLLREAETWIIPLDTKLTAQLKAGKTYRVELELEHRDGRGKRLHREKRKLKLSYRGTYQIFD